MHIKAITFDYFGTLVDVDQGGISGMKKVLAETQLEAPGDIAQVYLDWDIRNVRLYRGGKYRKYREVAQEALAATLDTLAPGVSASLDIPALTDMYLVSLVEDAAPHPDSVEVLTWLAERYPLMPITNMDSDLWRRSRLTHFFEHVTTAEMAKAYKPSADIFKLALERLAVPPEHVLHCSLASWADIDGAKPLGMNVAWVNRGKEALGTWQPRPDFEFDNLYGVRNLLNTDKH
ncbi:HAD family hydrolase [Noviherbaspirillum denitrificans]|uniref:Hydrolase n=1 Tax=Noviherbaspirillum denitrificans TaxID=1968433 RepID=A0A254TAE0_9BURK|nr:HAD family hydrolase [Noviherbaspirillum denitrificans]OWW19604.1 hydrolase [Noviherbaspirillum denitrificans]